MLIEVGCNDFYELAFDEIKIVTNYIKKVNLNNPSKQGVMGKIFGIDMLLDYASMTHSLYNELSYMRVYMNGFQMILSQIDILENKYKEMINNYGFNNTTSSNKVVFLGQMKALQELKSSVLMLENCFRLILENPDIQKFCYYWKKFKKNYKFPKKMCC